MDAFLRYWFYPNPGNAAYQTPSMVYLLILCGALIIASILIRFWRSRLTNPVTKKLSRSWGPAAFWFGIVGLVLIVCRVEQIQFLAMRFTWVLWFAVFAVYVIIQIRLFRMRHYEVLPKVRYEDPLEKYLPKKKKH